MIVLARVAVLAGLAGVTVAAACAGSGGAGGAAAGSKYPPRPAGCKVALIQGPKPAAARWDDLGSAEANCRLDEGNVQCLQKLRAVACRMGGDVVYDVPKKALRPTEQGMIFHGRVAHTRTPKPEEADPTGGKRDSDLPPPASEEESRGPVTPLGGAPPAEPAPSARAADGGAPP